MTINQGMNLRARQALGIGRDETLPTGIFPSKNSSKPYALVDGNMVWVNPRSDFTRRAVHRVMIACSKCGHVVSAGRWEQHCKGKKHNDR
jgi:hypothetical protein